MDMCKRFDAWSGNVSTGMSKEVLSGYVYIFVGKSRDKIKLLIWRKIGLFCTTND
ncbi:IS66 family insertion sequence element accessory protein TnpB [Rhodocytophaga aerolata]|uniref:IS66 family insertion sequence element accessory protein TnpB n=1 Tax=Rhodocytophaga aerolata TaxID=455078 RepID=A0ABT8R4J7_9BACT|nr:IS66 family insertion sequence element accessory protein TnpB [Rhodocytophaga aerolata]MDO1447014.1 IS66 family insertion sequence element accessory protein TnpB [Rhodocytophaga aerolata]